MKNYMYETELLQFRPFHPANCDSYCSFNYIETDMYRDKGEKLIEINIDEKDGDFDELLSFTMEEAQARQLRDFLNKFFGE